MYDEGQDRFMGGPVAPPPPPEPFTQADNLELQRLQAGVAGARKALYDGEIDDQTHRAYQQELMGRMAPLAERQRQAQQQMQQMETMQAMHQHALQQAVEQQASQFRAQGLNQRVATYTDPMTGKTAHLIEDGQGKVREIDFGDPQDHLPLHAALSMGEDQGGDPEKGYQNPALSEGVPSPQPEEGPGGGPQEPAGPMHPATPLDKPFEQVIYNGGKRTVTRWAGDGTPGKIIEGGPPAGSAAAAELEAAGKAPEGMATPALAQWAREQAGTAEPAGKGGFQGGLSHAQIATLYNRANGSIPQLPQNAPAHLQALRAQSVNSLAGHLIQNELTLQRHVQQQASQAKAATLASERRETAAETRDRMAKDRKEHDEKISGWYDTALKAVEAESKDWASKRPGSSEYVHDQAGRPDWSRQPESQEEEAWNRVKKKYTRLHGEDLSISKPGEAVKAAIQPKAQATPSPASAAEKPADNAPKKVADDTYAAKLKQRQEQLKKQQAEPDDRDWRNAGGAGMGGF